jgi:hypothetical protein
MTSENFFHYGVSPMTIPSARITVVLIFLMSPIVSSAKSPDQADPWLMLKKITHKRDYQLQTRDHKCWAAKIIEVTSDSLIAVAYSWSATPGKRVTFPRAEVLSLKAGRHMYYSGRSSWLDVKLLGDRGRERLKIITTTGKVYKVKPPYNVSDDGIMLDNSGGAKLSKSEIAQVYHIVEKPLTDTGEYFMDELGPLVVFDPDMWEYGLHLEPYVAVLLYDTGKPEDNSPATCER